MQHRIYQMQCRNHLSDMWAATNYQGGGGVIRSGEEAPLTAATTSVVSWALHPEGKGRHFLNCCFVDYVRSYITVGMDHSVNSAQNLHNSSGEFQISEVVIWKRAPIFSDIGTFAVPLST